MVGDIEFGLPPEVKSKAGILAKRSTGDQPGGKIAPPDSPGHKRSYRQYIEKGTSSRADAKRAKRAESAPEYLMPQRTPTVWHAATCPGRMKVTRSSNGAHP